MDFEEKMEELLGERFLMDYPMKEYTSFKIGGPAKYLVYPENLMELTEIMKEASAEKMKTYVLGYGTNVLVKDGGINGCVISTKRGFQRLDVWEEGGHIVVSAECGVSLSEIVKCVAEKGGEGVEILAGIPGSLGGAVRMNAGTSSGEISQFVKMVKIVDDKLKIKELEGDSLPFKYRRFAIPKRWFISEAYLSFKKGEPEHVLIKVSEQMEYRRRTQPHGRPSAGCIFKNPPGIKVGVLIEELNLKGLRVRGARISEKHGNFVVNEGNATARDVLAVVDAIRKKVKEETGLFLEMEIEVIGEE